MKRILLVGYDPETVDFADPALPPVRRLPSIHGLTTAPMLPPDGCRLEPGGEVLPGIP